MERGKRAYFYALWVVLLWATVASAFKITLRYLEPVHLLFGASAVSVGALFLILIFQKKLDSLRHQGKRDYFNSALLGFLNPFSYYLILFQAYSLLPAQEAQPLNQTWAIILPIFSIILLRQKIGLKSILALIISFFGVLIIITHGKITRLSFTNPLGIFLALGSAFIWSLFWIYNIRDKRDEVVKLFLNFVFGFMFIAIFLIASGRLTISYPIGLLGAVYVGLFEMGITFLLWLKALSLSKTTAQVSNLIYLVPFLSLIIINLTVGERITVSTIIGLAFIVIGIVLQNYRPSVR